ncbi:MAG: porphobilinogen synthase, partial [Flavobacteriales bacterium]|nr:porphobilinogen synthase [Flavobacteriales bacterium]
MSIRPRRLRTTPIMRNMVAETRLSADMFIYPYFVVHGDNHKEEIGAMPGVYHFSVDELLKDVEKGLKHGINKILLFGVGEEKSKDGSSSSGNNSIVLKAVSALKDKFGADLMVITDVCVCAYTDHGHCGVLENGYVQNDETLDVLSAMALAHAEAGADIVAPSDMMDGRV